MRLIVMLDLRNTFSFPNEKGEKLKTLAKGSTVVLGNPGDENPEHLSDYDRAFLTQFKNLLVRPETEGAKRALLEADWERARAIKVAALLKQLNAKTVSEARGGGGPSGFLAVHELSNAPLRELLTLLRSEPPPPPRASFFSTLFKPKEAK